jgi:hypothetical protein
MEIETRSFQMQINQTNRFKMHCSIHGECGLTAHAAIGTIRDSAGFHGSGRPARPGEAGGKREKERTTGRRREEMGEGGEGEGEQEGEEEVVVVGDARRRAPGQHLGEGLLQIPFKSL